MVKELDTKSKPKAYDWKFTRQNTGDKKEIIFDSDPIFTSQSGLINNWIGYGRTTLVCDAVAGTVAEVKEEPQAVLALTNELEKAKGIEDRFNGGRLISENVHEAYWSSYIHNLQQLATLSRAELAISFSNLFHDVKPLDITMFSENSTESGTMSSEYHSGLYIVSKVVRTIMSKRIVTTVLLNREALNQVRNS
jgi:hypothetical protein